MSEHNVTLRLQANNSRLVPPVRESREEVKKLGDTATQTGQQSRASAAGIRSVGDAAERTKRQASAMTNALNAAKAAVGAYMGIQGAKALVNAADTYSDIVGKLAEVTSGERQLAQAQRETLSIANTYYQQLDATVTLYGRSARALSEYGYQQSTVAAMTKTVSAGLLVSRATTAESASAMLQLSQALGAGALRGEEFNAVNEAAPRLMTALARSMGVARGELKQLAEDGKLTIDVLVKAWTGEQARQIEEEASRVPLTIGRAWQVAKNEMLVYIGEQDQGISASAAVAQGIALVARNVGLLATAATATAVAYGGRLVASMVSAAATKVQAIAQTRALALVELEAARAAETAAAARLANARAGMAGAAGIVQAEAAMAAATARTAAATQAASIALTAKAAATRAASAAMAAFGGPVGLAVTALTLFVLWASNSKAKADELARTVTTGFQDSIKMLRSFNEESANNAFAGLASSFETLDAAKQRLEALEAADRALEAQRMRSISRIGVADAGLLAQQANLREELERARVAHQQLADAADNTVAGYARMVLESAGVEQASAAQQRATQDYIRSLTDQGMTLEQVKPLLVEHTRVTYGVEAATRLMATSFDQAGAAATNSATKIAEATAKLSEGLNKQLASAELRLIEQTQGKAAALREALSRDLAEKGIAADSDEGKRLAEINEKLIAVTLSTERHTKATQAATSAASEAKRKAEEHRRELEQQAESQRRYADEAERLAAALDGPLAEAEVERKQRIADLDAALAKHLITQDTYNQLVATAIEQERRRAAEIAIDQAAPQALLDTMTGELQILTMMGPARERYQRQLRAEQDMRRAINDANRAGAKINDEVTDSLVAQARAYAGLSVAIEEQVADLYELADVAVRSASDASGLFADMLTNNLDKSKSFFSQLKDIFKKGFRDLLATLMEQNFVRPFQDMLTNAITGAFNGASSTGSGGWMSQLAGMIGGGRNLTGTAQMAGSGWMTNAASSSGSLMGFGNNMGNFLGMGGTASGATGGGMGWLGGAMSSVASFMPWVALIMAGMQMAGDAYAEGFGLANQSMSDMVLRGSLASGGLLTPVMLDSWSLDKIGKALGMSDKTAAIFSGSSLLGKAFGRAAPKVQASGITGSYGFNGLDARTYADIKAKGGWFRSDKKWTEYGAVDPAISGAFSQAASQVKSAAVALSDQLGLDISSQLSAVRVDIGKFQLDADPEKAQAQLTELIEDMVLKLTDASVRAVGFGQFLDKGHDAADVMTALSLASDLAGGSVDQLARIMTVLQAQALSAGITLTEQVQTVVQAANTYASIVAEASTEIATAGFSNFAKQLLQIRQEEKQRTRSLQEQAKALGLTAAREQDLATVREAAQRKTDALILGLESELIDLAINRLNDQIQQLGGSLDGAGNKLADFIASLRLSDTLSPDTDAVRRDTAQTLMNSAAAAGNVDDFIKYATEFLDVSRALNASSLAYRADYDAVQRMAAQMAGNSGAADGLAALYEQRAALQAQVEAAARLERAQRIAQGVADLVGVRGGDPLALLQSLTGISGADLARDLGMSTDELAEYLAEQQTDIGDLADILYDLPTRIASELVSVLVDRMAVPAPGGGLPPASVGGSQLPVGGGSLPADQGTLDLLSGIQSGINRLVNQTEMVALR